MFGGIAAPYILLDFAHGDLIRVLQRIPLEQDLVCRDIDLVEQSVDDIHVLTTAGGIAAIGLGDIDRRNDHGVVRGDDVFVHVDVGLSRDTVRRAEIILQRNGINLPISIIENMHLSISIS